jgi:hypothetical protein
MVARPERLGSPDLRTASQCLRLRISDKKHEPHSLSAMHSRTDTTAQIFWLKNRRPDLWRDVKKIDSEPEMVKQTYSGEALLAKLKERGFVELEGEYTIVGGQDESHPTPTPGISELPS